MGSGDLCLINLRVVKYYWNTKWEKMREGKNGVYAKLGEGDWCETFRKSKNEGSQSGVFEMGNWIGGVVREVSDYDKSINKINGVECGVPSMAN